MRKYCYNIANILLLGIFTIQNAQAEIFAFQNTMPAKLFINNTKGASYLFLNGVYILPGGSKYYGPNWAGSPCIGCNVTYGRCFWNNIGTDIEIACSTIEAEYNSKTDKGTPGRAGVNITYNLLNGEVKDSLNNIILFRSVVAIQAGYGWSGYSYTLPDYATPVDDQYSPPYFNYESDGFDVPISCGAVIPVFQRISVQPYLKYVYHCRSLYYCVPVYEYILDYNEYRWNSQEYEQLKKYWVYDYGMVVSIIPIKKVKNLKIYTGCSFSKSPDQKENNVSFSLGLLKEWGKKYK